MNLKPPKQQLFIKLLTEAIHQKSLVKLIISNKRERSSDLRTVNIRLVQLKKGLHLCFVYRHETKDVTKNFEHTLAVQKIEALLENQFYQVFMETSSAEVDLILSHKGKVKLAVKEKTKTLNVNLSHDHEKRKWIDPKSSIYLKELGISSQDGEILKGKHAKFRQINKFIEIIKNIVNSTKLGDQFSVVDMGSGKGYLTFALYDYLTSINIGKKEISISGIEFRQELVDTCNEIASLSGFKHLNFIQGNIENAVFNDPEVLIALHACNTATDDAIYRGIRGKSKIIICSPCCHKQVRKQMSDQHEFDSITQFGILKERQAEIVTDTIRALILEAYGYKTKVMEFISTEHTPKNLLIVGVLEDSDDTPRPTVLQKVKHLKDSFGIGTHHLEKLLGIL